MKDTIYREDAIEAIKGNSYAGDDDYIEINGYGAIEDIRALPSADRPQGEWLIEKTLYGNYNYRCSYCDWCECHAYPDVEPYNYCPNCGTRMKGTE